MSCYQQICLSPWWTPLEALKWAKGYLGSKWKNKKRLVACSHAEKTTFGWSLCHFSPPWVLISGTAIKHAYFKSNKCECYRSLSHWKLAVRCQNWLIVQVYFTKLGHKAEGRVFFCPGAMATQSYIYCGKNKKNICRSNICLEYDKDETFLKKC